jgi:hypothetical protein
LKKLSLLLLLFLSVEARAQVCDSLVPTYYVNFTGSAAGTTWSSPYVSRLGYCCSASGFDRCIDFIVTTDSSTSALLFSFLQPNPPTGTLYYQVDCGPVLIAGVDTQQIGTCGTHCITCCKPGNQTLQYYVTSITDTNAAACTGYSQCSGIMSANTVNSKVSVSLFPNPFHSSAALRGLYDNGELTIYTIYGQLIRSEFIEKENAVIRRDLLSEGIYFFRFTNKAGEVAIGKFVIE